MDENYVLGSVDFIFNGNHKNCPLLLTVLFTIDFFRGLGFASVQWIFKALAKNTDCLSYGSTCSMTISIDDDFQKKGYSRKMLACMIKNIEREWPDIPLEKMFFIDADASAGFWDHIGYVENRYGYDYFGLRDLEGKGYEKNITLRDLKAFIAI